MELKTVDLYEYFGKQRGGVNGGYLTGYVRSPYPEIKPKARPAMLVLPGGGYGFLSEREGEPVALNFLSKGYSSFVLKYSINTAHPVPLIEACMAVAYIRKNAEYLCVDKAHVGAIGFSAGGHLTGMLATMNGAEEVKEALGQIAETSRPDAVVLSYPVVTMQDGVTHDGTRKVITDGGKIPYDTLSLEKRVSKGSVPAFIWHTMEDDCVPVENSLLLALAYKKAGVPFALHIFEKGWHGLSLANEEVYNSGDIVAGLGRIDKWFELALDWLELRGFKVKAKEYI